MIIIYEPFFPTVHTFQKQSYDGKTFENMRFAVVCNVTRILIKLPNFPGNQANYCKAESVSAK